MVVQELTAQQALSPRGAHDTTHFFLGEGEGPGALDRAGDSLGAICNACARTSLAHQHSMLMSVACTQWKSSTSCPVEIKMKTTHTDVVQAKTFLWLDGIWKVISFSILAVHNSTKGTHMASTCADEVDRQCGTARAL